jgi:hypothetical protein
MSELIETLERRSVSQAKDATAFGIELHSRYPDRLAAFYSSILGLKFNFLSYPFPRYGKDLSLELYVHAHAAVLGQCRMSTPLPGVDIPKQRNNKLYD